MADEQAVELNADRDPDRGRHRVRIVTVVKVVIAFIVAIGLVFATRSAVTQWNLEKERIQQQISDLDRQISESSSNASASQIEQLRAQRSRLAASLPVISNLDWKQISLASLIYGFALIPPAFVLRFALLTFGDFAQASTCVASQLLGHAGKYVPGKAMVIVLRVGALTQVGVRPVPAIISVFMETLLMMAVGAAVAGVIICSLPVPAWMTWTAAIVAVAATIPTLPPILRKVASRVSHVKLSPASEPTSSATSQQSFSSTRFFITGWLLSLVSWLLIGISFSLLVAAIPSTKPLPDWPSLIAICTASIGLAMVIGFASLLPGGAGVRELVLTTVLATSVGSAQALLSAVAARLMFIAVEAIAALAAWLWLRFRRTSRFSNAETDIGLGTVETPNASSNTCSGTR